MRKMDEVELGKRALSDKGDIPLCPGIVRQIVHKRTIDGRPQATYWVVDEDGTTKEILLRIPDV